MHVDWEAFLVRENRSGWPTVPCETGVGLAPFLRNHPRKNDAYISTSGDRGRSSLHIPTHERTLKLTAGDRDSSGRSP